VPSRVVSSVVLATLAAVALHRLRR
jgi:hypothetical protein